MIQSDVACSRGQGQGRAKAKEMEWPGGTAAFEQGTNRPLMRIMVLVNYCNWLCTEIYPA
jgi:hypothetical protein